MIERARVVVLGTALAFALASCTEHIDGGGCRYESYPGVATIISIRPSATPAVGCSDPVDIVYRFTPDDPEVARNYEQQSYADDDRLFSDVGGMHRSLHVSDKLGSSGYLRVPRSLANELELLGNVPYPAERAEEVGSGVCFPVLYTWTAIRAAFDDIPYEQVIKKERCSFPSK